jgi:hypothetical protein
LADILDTDKDKALEMQANLRHLTATEQTLRADGHTKLADEYAAQVDTVRNEVIQFLGNLGIRPSKDTIADIQNRLYAAMPVHKADHLVTAAEKARISLQLLTNDSNMLTETRVTRYRLTGKGQLVVERTKVRVNPTVNKTKKGAAPAAVSAVTPTTTQIS